MAKNLAEKIGEWTYIGEDTHIAQRTVIGRYCSISNSCTIGAQQHRMTGVTTYPALAGDYDQKRTRIGHDVWIGCNSVVMSGVTIGTGAVIGAGSVVTRDVPPYAVVYGNPARVRRYRFNQTIINALLQSEWWKYDYKTISALPEGAGPLQGLRILRKWKS